MTVRVILARHGNTFGSNDIPVWIGARTDLALVEKGLDQAEALAGALLKYNIPLTAILSGPLRRTRETARIVAEALHIDNRAVRIDDRLKEIDYGDWEGKSTEELIANGHGEDLALWNRESLFPVRCGWQPVEGQIMADVNFILSELLEGTTLIVTSNGILRFFANAAINAAEITERKVATGHICAMERDDKGDWHVRQWNQPPHLLNIG